MYVGLTMVEENHEPLAFGTLANCSERCLWVGKNGELVEANTFRDQMISTSNIEKNDYEHVRRNLELHMNYIEGKRIKNNLFK
jgi:hypothetical protein